MKKNKKYKKLYLLIFTFFIVLGFAYLTSNLDIHGMFSLGNKRFDVHVSDSIYYFDTNCSDSKVSVTGGGTSLDFDVLFTNPGDKYEFLMDVVNEGTVDAMLNLNVNGLDEETSKYIKIKLLYLNDEEFIQNSKLLSYGTERLHVVVEYNIDELDELPDFNKDISININVNGEVDNGNGVLRSYPTLYETIYNQSTLDNIKSRNVSSSNGIDYSDTYSTTNGLGYYVYNSTKSDQYPMVFARGDTNNYISDGEFCWRILRTAENGGVKAIYNGLSDDRGRCSSTGDDLSIGKTVFNIDPKFPTMIGYMYDMEPLPSYTKSQDVIPDTASDYIVYFGKDITYSNGMYHINDADTNTIYVTYDTYESGTYICPYSDSCSEIYYLISFLFDSDEINTIKFSGGTTYEDILNEFDNAQNLHNSTIKDYIENWYSSNISDSYLENMLDDVIYCNDRRVYEPLKYGYHPDGLYPLGTTFQAYYRSGETYVGYGDFTFTNYLDFTCKKSDSFTISSNLGNGKNLYPVGLITNDEAKLVSSDYFDLQSWTMTPATTQRSLSYSTNNAIFITFESSGRGDKYNFGIYNSIGNYVRPVVAFKWDVAVIEGDGNKDNPYILNIGID